MLRDFIILFFIAAALISVVYAIVNYERLQESETAKRRALDQVASMRASIEQSVQANILVLKALKPEILWQDTPDRERLKRVIDEFLNSDLSILHLAVAPDLKVSFVYPLAGNEPLIGVDYTSVEAQYPDIQQAIDRREIVFNGPVDLVQGGTAFIARVPIYNRNDSLWGIASLVIDDQQLFERIEFFQHPEYRFVLHRETNSGQLQHIVGPTDVLQQQPMITHVLVPGERWQLAIAPRSGQWLAQQRSYWPHWLIGLTAVALFSAAFASLIITQRRLRAAVDTISYQARFDPLTNLINRNYFQQRLEQRIASAREHSQRFALVMLDLDHLRDINDALGQDVGDGLLQHVALQLQSSLRSNDLIARVGGDEFIVLLADIDNPAIAEQRAKEFISDLLDTADIEQNHINITTSVGIALYPTDASSAQQLTKCAELAMYAAKSTGSLSVSFYDPALRQNTEQHIALHHDMINALESSAFHVEYQPVIETASGLIKHCEALIRWQHPEHGAISPAQFIPIAEKTGAIVWLGEYVLKQVVQDWQLMRDQGLDITIAINRSPREFNDKDVASRWLATLAEGNMPPDRLMIEITESLLMRDQEQQQESLKHLRSAGIHLAIDDFGTGYSSLNYLRFYPIDSIKIDRSFMQDIPANQKQAALVEALIRVAHTLDLNVIAEGVETRAQVEFLRSQNCHSQQGFYYSRSLQLDTFIDYCKQFNQRVSR